MEGETDNPEDRLHWRVCVRRKDINKILTNLEEIERVFRVHLCSEDEVTFHEDSQSYHSDLIWFSVAPENTSTTYVANLLPRLQRYLESASCGGEEDSSYDSDCEDPSGRGHDDVSRTTSDTLGAEFAEYVCHAASLPSQQPPGYAQRVEFALKLGYTERHVQAALAKLGPSPAQNELLAELIRLGAAPPHLLPETEATEDEEPEENVSEVIEESPVCGPLPGQLRHIVIDGSNVAMSHGNKERFSCRGIKICVDWFRARGHREITVFVPRWRKEASRPERPITDQEILNELERDRLLVFTPSRLVGGKRVACYDDRYVLKLAAETEGIVVSNDNYRDLCSQRPEFRRVVEERILMYSFVNDKFMPPDDPLGRSGPTLEHFLRVQGSAEPPRPCPYGKKCTYGNKCKYAHPERGPLPHKSVSERLAEQHAQRQLQARTSGACRDHSPGDQLKGKSLSLPPGEAPRKTPLSRTRSSAPSNLHLQQQQQSAVCKSRSVESVRHLQWAPEWMQSGHVAVAKQLSDPPQQQPQPQSQQQQEEPANLHRKLQRQLTLNPAYDPRLCHLQHGYPTNAGYAEHRPVARHSSDYRPPPTYLPPSGWGGDHQSVTRIASAPEPLPPRWPPAPTAAPAPPPPHHLAQRLSACSSEPNLMWPPQQQQQQHVTAHGERSRLCYHLSSIFPAEQVQAAMRLLPDETNPQKICAAILEMFRHDQAP